MIKGADLASPTSHGTGCFFALPCKSVHILSALKKRPVKSPKWHWLFLPPIGANVDTYIFSKAITKAITIYLAVSQ